MQATPDWAGSYIGIKFFEQGRSREAGVDCYGLAALIMNEIFHVELPDYSKDYEPGDVLNKPAIGKLIANKSCENDWRFIDSGSEKAGDIVLLNLLGYPCHVGVVACPGKMIHITEGASSIIEAYNGKMWSHRTYGILRHRSLEKK